MVITIQPRYTRKAESRGRRSTQKKTLKRVPVILWGDVTTEQIKELRVAPLQDPRLGRSWEASEGMFQVRGGGVDRRSWAKKWVKKEHRVHCS